MNALLLAHVSATWFMVGLIWTIQVVHYPLFKSVGPAAFVRYEAEHTSRMGILLTIPATVEVVTGGLLVWHKPASVSVWLVLLAGSILAAIWIITLLVQVPIHRKLSQSHDTATIARLVRSNWLRTVAWSTRGVLVAILMLQT